MKGLSRIIVVDAQIVFFPFKGDPLLKWDFFSVSV